MGSGYLLGFGGMCQNKDTVCQLCTAFNTKLSQNGLEVKVWCHEKKNIEESLIGFLFGYGRMIQHIDSRCQL